MPSDSEDSEPWTEPRPVVGGRLCIGSSWGGVPWDPRIPAHLCQRSALSPGSDWVQERHQANWAGPQWNPGQIFRKKPKHNYYLMQLLKFNSTFTEFSKIRVSNFGVHFPS